MNQLQERQRVVYVQEPAEIVYVQRKPPLSTDEKLNRVAGCLMLPFVLGVMTLAVLAFVVRDVDWLIGRAAAAVAILFLFGTGGSMVAAVFLGVRDFFGGWR